MTTTVQRGDPANQDAVTIGDAALSAWRVAPGVVWVQTRLPKHAQRLSKRSDSRLVVTGVAGGYLRTFEFRDKTLGWAQRLIERYTKSDEPDQLD